MSRPRWHDGPVLWSGENPFMRLGRDGVEDVTRLSFFRVVWSPLGHGHALFIVTDALPGADGGPFTAQLTDHPDLSRWLYDTCFVSEYWRSRSFPLIRATFATHGDIRHSRTELIASAQHTIALTWSDLKPPAAFCADAEKPGEVDLLSMVIPAGQAEVQINGVAARGEPFTMNFGGRRESSCCLAFSETWLKPPLR